MSMFDEARNDAEKLAKEHPEQVDEAIKKGEQEADQRTGDKYDKQVGEAGQRAEDYLTGQQGQGQQDQGQGQQDQGQAAQPPRH